MNANTMHTLADAYHDRGTRIITTPKCFDLLDLVQASDIIPAIDIPIMEIRDTPCQQIGVVMGYGG